MTDDPAQSPAALPPAGTVVGIGIDIVETARIGAALREFGNRFIDRVFLPSEIDYCRAMQRPSPHFAARFAAKEAVAKAFGTGVGKEIGWHDVEIGHSKSGGPVVVLHGGGAAMALERRVVSVLLSLSHSAHYAVANAVLISGG